MAHLCVASMWQAWEESLHAEHFCVQQMRTKHFVGSGNGSGHEMVCKPPCTIVHVFLRLHPRRVMNSVQSRTEAAGSLV